MLRNPEAFGIPQIALSLRDSTSPVHAVPQRELHVVEAIDPHESPEDTARKATEEAERIAYEARLAAFDSPTLRSLAGNAELERVARQAMGVLEDTLRPEFEASLPRNEDGTLKESLIKARGKVWDRFLRGEEGREDMLTTPRDELGKKSPWLAIKGDVETELHITRAPLPKGRVRTNLYS